MGPHALRVGEVAAASSNNGSGDGRARILVVATSFAPAVGGLEQLSFRLVSGFRRVAPRVVALDEPGAGAFDYEHGLDIRRVFNRPPGGRRSVARLAAAATVEGARSRPGLVLSMHIRASYAALALQRTLHVPFVQYVHAKELGDQPRLARLALRHADATVAVSSYTAELAIHHGAKADRTRVIHPGVDMPDTARTEPGPVPTMVTVSRLDDEYKGHDRVIEALPRIRAAVPDVRWLVVGDGTLRNALEAQVRALDLTSSVSFLGAVSDDERDRALESAHLFVLPSRVAPDGSGGEGFGIAYLEASARGIPVIAARSGGAVDAVVDGETGLLVEPNDVKGLAAAAIALLIDPERARTLGAGGVARARHLSWSETVEQVEDVVREVLTRRR